MGTDRQPAFGDPREARSVELETQAELAEREGHARTAAMLYGRAASSALEYTREELARRELESRRRGSLAVRMVSLLVKANLPEGALAAANEVLRERERFETADVERLEALRASAAAAASTPPIPAPTVKASPRPRIALVAIHGVADQEAGATARALANKLMAAEVLSGAPEEKWVWRRPVLPARHDSPKGDVALRAALRHRDRDVGEPYRALGIVGLESTVLDADVDVHEVHWADLSRPGDSLLGMILAGLGILLRLPEVGLRALGHSYPGETPATKKAIRSAFTWFSRGAFTARTLLVLLIYTGLGVALGLAPLQLAITDAEAARVVGAALPPVLSIGAWIAFAPPSSATAERQTWRLPLLLVLLTAAIWGALYVFARSYAGFILIVLLGAGWALLGGWMFSRILAGRRARQLAVFVAAFFGILFLALCLPAFVQEWEARTPTDREIEFASHLVDPVVHLLEIVYACASLAYVAALVMIGFGALRGYAAFRGTHGALRARMRAALRTTLLAQFVPMLALLLFAIPVLAAVFRALGSAGLVPHSETRPWIFRPLLDYVDVPIPAASDDSPVPISILLEALVRGSGTRALVFVIIAIAIAAVAIVIALAPSVVGEIAPRLFGHGVSPRMQRRADQISRWMEGATGFIAIALELTAGLCATAILVGHVLEVVLCASWRWTGERLDLGPVAGHSALLSDTSGRVVVALGLALVGSAGVLALPGRLRQVIKPIWPALDIAFDVDAYMRLEARARILARANATLTALRESGHYAAVVLVAHSQGTMIAADVVRSSPVSIPTFLVTAGSPMVNLYHRFFPFVFPWVEQASSDPSKVLGVRHWSNVFGAADYVGRETDSSDLLSAIDRAMGEERPRSEQFSQWTFGLAGHVQYWDVGEPRLDRFVEAVFVQLARARDALDPAPQPSSSATAGSAQSERPNAGAPAPAE